VNRRAVPAGPGSRPAWTGFGAAVPLVGAETNLQLTGPLLWTMVAIGAAGACITFAFLVYALWKFRDPSVRRRRYG